MRYTVNNLQNKEYTKGTIPNPFGSIPFEQHYHTNGKIKRLEKEECHKRKERKIMRVWNRLVFKNYYTAIHNVVLKVEKPITAFFAF